MSAKVISLAAQHAPSEYAMAERYLDAMLEALRAEVHPPSEYAMAERYLDAMLEALRAEVHPRREYVPLSVRQFESRLLAYEIQEALR